MLKKLLSIAAVAAITVSAAVASYKAPEMDFEIDVPKAEGIKKGTIVVSQKQYADMDKFFQKTNAVARPQVKASNVVNENTINPELVNLIIQPSMLDSAFAAPHSGVQFALLENLVDCCGVFIFQDGVGGGAAHVTCDTNLQSLTPLLSCFNIEANSRPVVTIISSYKSALLTQLYNYLDKCKFSPSFIWTTKGIFNQNKAGTTVKKFLNPDHVPLSKQALKKLDKASIVKNNKKCWEILSSQTIHNEDFAAPVDMLMDLKDGQLYWPGTDFTKRRQVAMAIAIVNSEINPMCMTWAALRYKNEVEPKVKEVLAPDAKRDLAFVKYPVVLQ